MALCRLSVAEKRLLLQKEGFFKPARRWCSSSASPSTSKKSKKTSPSKKMESMKEQRAIAVESVVKKYMELNPGVFPKVTQVHEEVGGSWYILKDILTVLKERMTVNTQIQTEIASAKEDTTVEEASKVTTIEENPDSSTPKSRVQLSDTTADLHMHQKSLTGEKSLVTVEKASDATVMVEDSNNAKLVEARDGYQLSDKHSNEAMQQHERDQEASEQLAGMISQMLGEEADRESPNGFYSNDAKSNKGTLVENEDNLPERKVTSSLAQDWKSVPSSMPVSNGRKVTSLSDIFKTQEMDARADEQMGMANGASKNAWFSDVTKGTPTGDNDRRESRNSGLRPVKDFAKSPQLRAIFDQFYRPNRGPRHENSRVIVPERSRLLNQDGKQKTPSGPSVRDEIEKPERKEKQVWLKESSYWDFIVKDDNAKEDKSCCGGMDRLDKEEERTRISFDMFDSQYVSEDESGSECDIAASDYLKAESTMRIQPTQPTGKGLNTNMFLYTEKGREQKSLVVKFLPKSAKEENIHVAFAFFGPISKICIVPSREENWFNYAYVYFKTEEGLRKALTRREMVVGGADVAVEAGSPLLKMPDRICSPDLVRVPNVPTALLKNPTRTVMIKGLHEGLAFHHLRRALSSCGCISSFTMGPSSDVVYVEFETEDAKEKALATPFISVSGKQLSLLRIDTPRTTVVRISNTAKTVNAKIYHICASYGKIKRLVRRGIDIVDVQFQLIEWANMVKILNRLNGLVIDGHRWVARPGTVIPAEILQTLWSEPDGRQYVCSLIQKLCGEIQGGLIDAADVTGLVSVYYREALAGTVVPAEIHRTIWSDPDGQQKLRKEFQGASMDMAEVAGS
ncbi:uncharacterized protein LOC131240424 isoform X1 [Magnolia sinica]|uniref:uncharacterized protein LOC131240424 isoform X1 n=1 Tax=Magnolia sinica TaxID=86752 RepID=UPI00265A55F5|nr:uncharacterized protein LOC131240424 isoform X1 [Magnolia sinica]